MNMFGYLLTCFCALVSTGYTLECYQCQSFSQNDCFPQGKMVKRITCPKMSGPQFCIYKEIYDNTLQSTKYTSDCGSHNQVTGGVINWQWIVDQQCIVPLNSQARECKICLNDLCNTVQDRNYPLNSYTYRAQSVQSYFPPNQPTVPPAPPAVVATMATTSSPGSGTVTNLSLIAILGMILSQIFVQIK